MRWLRVVALAVVLVLLPGNCTRPGRPIAASKRACAPILMYHRIGTAPTGANEAKYYVSPEVFEQQMRFLVENDYRPVRIDQITAALAGGPPVPPRAVAITFDDGAQDSYTQAFPILRAHKLTATFLIITRWVGTPGYLTWAEIAEMQQAGMYFGAHSLTHRRLSTLDPAEAEQEIRGSKAELEEHLGEPVTVFAYPGGDASPHVKALVEAAGFTAALGIKPPRGRHAPRERFYLARRAVWGGISFERFERWLRPACRWIP